jgi:hypothetical protein
VTEKKPYSRDEYNKALIANALLDPFTISITAAMLMAGVLLGSLVFLAPAAAAVYIGSAIRTYFDEESAQKVLERERKRRGKAIESGRRPAVDPKTLAPPIARLIAEARKREQQVVTAIERSELPYEEVTTEVESFLAAMDATALRAQALYEALADTPPVEIQKRLAAVREGGLAETKELAVALDVQLTTMQRTERQLQRFYVEMERILVELDTVRGQVVSMSAAADRTQQDQLAADVRGLRERMGAVSEGMAEAYEKEGPA